MDRHFHGMNPSKHPMDRQKRPAKLPNNAKRRTPTAVRFNALPYNAQPQPLQPAHSAPRHKAPNYPAAPPHKPTQAPPPHGFLPAQIKKSPPRLVNSKYPLIFAPENKRERPHNKKGAIAQLVEQRTENPCVPGSIPGGTTFTKRRIMKTAEIQLFQRFFLYVLSAKICNLVQ